MSKGLEAFYEIKNKLIKVEGNTTYGSITDLANLNIIEKELKRLDKIDNEPIVPIHINRYNELSDKKDVLEIIKEKRVNVEALFYSSSCEDYNKHYTHYEDLTPEEYNIVKEIMIND